MQKSSLFRREKQRRSNRVSIVSRNVGESARRSSWGGLGSTHSQGMTNLRPVYGG